MKILVFGDVFGKAGRTLLINNINALKQKYLPDLTIANAENLAGGFGLTEKIYLELLACGIDCFTSGNHWADKKEVHLIVPNDKRLVVPANIFGVKSPQMGYAKLESKTGQKFVIINLIGQVFMKGNNLSPFTIVDTILDEVKDYSRTILVDIHAEASSEKYALAHYLTGRVSLLWGTHTHVQTADEQILDQKTGYMTDVGMTGPYDSVIGIKKEASLARFLGHEPQTFEPAKKSPWLCALIAEIDEQTGHCLSIERIQQRFPTLK